MPDAKDQETSSNWPHHRYALVLGIVYLAWFAALAINPVHRQDWMLESVLAVIGVIVLAVSAKHFPLSRVSYTLLFVFLILHSVGAHYTYSEVPYDAWFEAITGRTFNSLFGWERNHYDRLLHFIYGLLLAYPMREFFLRIADARGFWGYFLPLEFTMASSMIFELIEWGAATVFGGDLGTAYLGTQGDPWDAHKDMALASIGAVIAMALTAAINIKLQRDFAREWSESLRVKHMKPLGEDAIIEQLEDLEKNGDD